MLRSMLRTLIEMCGLSTMRPPHICVDKYVAMHHICQGTYETYSPRPPKALPGPRRCHATTSAELDERRRGLRLLFHRGPGPATVEDLAASRFSAKRRPREGTPRREVDALLDRASEGRRREKCVRAHARAPRPRSRKAA